VSSMPAAVPGLSGQLGTATRPDGTTQLTYNDKPLYTFVQDTKPGDATGDGFTDLGGTWHVVTP
jgi:predicted lipoprotein with Yx(FWY)xxD motif